MLGRVPRSRLLTVRGPCNGAVRRAHWKPHSRTTPLAKGSSQAASILSALAVVGTIGYYQFARFDALRDGLLWMDANRDGERRAEAKDSSLRKDREDAGGGGFNLKSSDEEIDAAVLQDDGLTATSTFAEDYLWRNCNTFCPPEQDKTGIARVDGTSCPITLPAEESIVTSFFPLPTHTWVFFGLFDGENGPSAKGLTSNALFLALVGALADLLTKYDPNHGAPNAGSTDTYTSSFDELAEPLPESNTIPFTPDVVRPSPPASEIEATIKRMFVEFDAWMTFESIAQLIRGAERAEAKNDGTARVFRDRVHNSLRCAEPSSGAVVGFYESDTRMYRVALTGDSRAVLGRPTNAGLYKARQLTEEQTPANPAERARLESLHPNTKLFRPALPTLSPNPDPNASTTLLGSKTTRAFGYGALKWGLDTQERFHRDFLGDAPYTFFADGSVPPPSGGPPGLLDTSLAAAAKHPYMTAEPEITSVKVQSGDFVVLGTKGLWQCLSNEEVVGLVGAWLEERRAAGLPGARDGAAAAAARGGAVSMRDPDSLLELGEGVSRAGAITLFDISAASLPQSATRASRTVAAAELPVALSASGSGRSWHRDAWRWPTWGVKEKKFVVHANDLHSVSVHIARNAFGGADGELRATMLDSLTLGTDKVARFRDDLSVQVVFFE